MDSWIGLKRHPFLLQVRFIATLTCLELVMKIMNTLVRFGGNSIFLGEYHDLYLRTDVILLANVFEMFRRVCLRNYGLDPAHFYTAPGLAWQACLKKTGILLELLLDPDMLLMVERGFK